MKRIAAIQETVGHLGELGEPLLVVNEHSTRAAGARSYVQHMLKEHPLFSSAAIIATSATVAKTVEKIRQRTKDDKVSIIIPVGGDTTFNQAATAVEGTRHILCAIRAGNACNAPANLQYTDGRILQPHEVLERGTIQRIYPIEMLTDDERRIAVTIAGMGLLSRGARALNTWVRRVPGYKNPRVRDILHERTLLVSHTALSPKFTVTEHLSDGSRTERRLLDRSIVNARRIGHHAVFPGVSLTEPGAFMFDIEHRRDLWESAQRIQGKHGKTLDGSILRPDETHHMTVGTDVWGSVDGEDFRIEAGQQVQWRIGRACINVMATSEQGVAA